jgi:hypothetical protein
MGTILIDMEERSLRSLIRLLIQEEAVHSRSGALLTEPDEADDPDDDDEPSEASVAASIGGGPAMPLGAGPSYPGPEPRSLKKARSELTRVTGDAFGGARPVRTK